MLNIGIISTWIGLGVTIGGFIWRIAILTTEIKANTKVNDALGKQLDVLRSDVKITRERMDIQLDKAIDKLEERITEMSSEIITLSTAVARIEGVLNGYKNNTSS